MPAHNSWLLVVTTMQAAAASFQNDADTLSSQLGEDTSSNIVNASRRWRMQMIMTAVGGFSMLEGILEQTTGWEKPLIELETRLRDDGFDSIAIKFEQFRLAINVLKHGSGRSYRELLKFRGLPFRIKREDQSCFEEGDVSEIPALIAVDENFLLRCAAIVEQAFIALEIPHVDVGFT